MDLSSRTVFVLLMDIQAEMIRRQQEKPPRDVDDWERAYRELVGAYRVILAAEHAERERQLLVMGQSVESALRAPLLSKLDLN